MINRIAPFIELVFWIVALVILATNPTNEHHFSLCPLAILGFDWCPGCGLGRSISALFHGQFAESIRLHWFGIPALLIIFHRVFQLINIKFNKQNNYLNYKEI